MENNQNGKAQNELSSFNECNHGGVIGWLKGAPF